MNKKQTKILDPLESVYVKVIDLLQETEAAGGQLNPGYARLKISEIAHEMNAALILTRQNLAEAATNRSANNIHYDDGKNHGGL